MGIILLGDHMNIERPPRMAVLFDQKCLQDDLLSMTSIIPFYKV